MKQKLLLKAMLLLCALVAGSSSVWAESETFTFGNGNGKDVKSTTAVTKNGVTVAVTQNGASNAPNFSSDANDVRFQDGNKMSITSTGTITQVVITYTSAAYAAKITQASFNVGTYSYKENATTGTWTGSSNNIEIVNSAGSQTRISQIAVTYTPGSGGNSVATPTFSPGTGTYTTAQNVTLGCTTDGTTIYYTTDGTTPTSSSTQYTGAIPVSSTTTIKAIAKKGDDVSNVASATYTIYPVLHAGTAGDPYTVADARNAIEANIGVTGVYVSGIVCEGGSELSSGAMNYWISDDGTETNKFEIYKGKGISGADFTATTDVKEGDEVVVKGDIKKFGSPTIYEFNAGSQLVSLTHSSNPLISVTPTSLTGFTYGKGFGPSAAQTFSVEGSNLTADISLSLGESNYEMCLTEDGEYSNSLSLTPSTKTVDATTVYVRLKAGLAVNASYNGNIALTSTGATNKAVSLAGSVTQPNFSWDLSTNSYSEASTNQVTWPGTYATMKNDKASSTTAANNYLGGDANKRTSSRFYTDQILTIAPTSGNAITSVEFTGTTEGFASALKNSTWSNATAAASSTTVTVTPTNGALPISATISGNCGFTAVKVYFEAVTSITLTPAKTYTTLTSSHNLDFTSVSSDLKAYIATEVNAGGNVLMTQVNKVPAGTGLVLKATTPGSAVNVPVFDGTGADVVSANKMAGSATATTAIAANGGYILSEGAFHPAKKGTLAAGKAYLNIAVSSAPTLTLDFGGETTGINAVNGSELKVNGEYYNLAGQRVAQPTKGLYIVNGKKVIIK